MIKKGLSVLFSWMTLVGLALLLPSCSSGPATNYYSLFPSAALGTKPKALAYDSIGIGPIEVPGYLNNSSIVSRTTSQRLNVSGVHAWAEPLDDAIIRVIQRNLQIASPDAHVQGFPWDMRNKPKVQLQIEFLEFDGVRGERIKLAADWVLIELEKNQVLTRGREELTVASTDASYSAYVSSLNNLLEQFSNLVLTKITE